MFLLEIIDGRDSQTLVSGKNKLNVMQSQIVGTHKLCDFLLLTPYESPGEIFTTEYFKLLVPNLPVYAFARVSLSYIK